MKGRWGIAPRWRRAAVVALALASASAAPASAAAAPPGPAAVSHPVERSLEATRAYWTPQRLRGADPGGLVLTPGGRVTRQTAARATARPDQPSSPSARAVDISSASAGYPDRVHGKVFFTIPGGSQPGDYVCSGTVVRSNGHDLVWTAGHCVDDSEFGGGFATNWAFVPAYDQGMTPAGIWPATRLSTSAGWANEHNIRQDFGAATIARDAQGHGIQDVVGGRAIAFDLARTQLYTAFGYPAEPTLFQPFFDGERLYSCDSNVTSSDNPPGPGPETMQIACDMSGGSSGGGWVTGSNAVAGLTSYSYTGDLDHLYGPYFGQIAKRLYTRASGPRLLCAGRGVSSLGDANANSFSGGTGADTFRLEGGDDRAAGEAGPDTACGGAGGDRLAGGEGADLLRGSSGDDLLVGGPGFDVCVGGPGRDRATGCEHRSQIP